MTAPRCPICGEVFEADEHEKAKRLRDVHIDWCEDVELARKRLKIGLPVPETCTRSMIKAAHDRLPDDTEPIQTGVDDW